MHHDTYQRLLWGHHEAEMQHLAGMREWLDKLERRSARAVRSQIWYSNDNNSSSPSQEGYAVLFRLCFRLRNGAGC